MGLFDLPKELRNAIYGLVLTIPQPLHIFQDTGGPLTSFGPKPRQWLSLLSTSRRLREEAAEVAFGTNRFNIVDFTEREADIFESFLTCIGPENSAKLKHLHLAFPAALGAAIDPVRLREHSVKAYALLREKCQNVATLELFVARETYRYIKPKDDETLIRAALALADEQIKSVQSLNMVTVKLYYRFNWNFVESAREFGWQVLQET